MSTAELLHKEIEKLPEALQEQVLEYVNFIQLNEQQKGGESLTEAQKKELKARYQRYLENPATGRSLEEVRKKMLEKYGWKTI